MRVLLRSVALIVLVLLPVAGSPARGRTAAPIRIAMLSFGGSPLAGRTANALTAAFGNSTGVSLVDRDLAAAAARGAGYDGSLNLTTQEAADVGDAIGCDFYFLGDVQTLRRSPAEKPVYFEAYATVFIVSARTGRLVYWDRRTQTAGAAEAAERALLAELDQYASRYLAALREAEAAERSARFAAIGHDLPVIEETPADDSPQANGFRPPAPYRRISPQYTPAANAAEVIATVDAQVDLDIEGEVKNVQIARWAGFGLDESVINAIRQMHFRPAMRNGVAFPIRVLLRYNFRKPR